MAKRARLSPPPEYGGPKFFGGRGLGPYLLFAVITIFMIGIFAWRLWTYASEPPTLPIIGEIAPPLPPMAQPSLAQAPALPDAAAITAERADAEAALAESPLLPLWAGGADAFAIAWAEAALALGEAGDVAPVGVGAWELASGSLRPGTAVRVAGDLLDAAPDTGGWRRAVIAPQAEAYIEILARGALPAVGERVEATGRFLGADRLPGADAPVALPLVVASRVAPTGADPVVIAGEPTPGDALWHEVDDERLIIEPRPYHALIGLVRDEAAAHRAAAGPEKTAAAAAPAPPSINAQSYPLHAAPDDYRGLPFTVVGTVVKAWEDEQIARERPFGVTRVARVILHQRDWSPYSVVFGADGASDEERAKFTKDAGKLTLRLYELAIPGDQPLPKPGTRLTARGRFLKFLARPVAPDPTRQVQALTDKVYTILLVAEGWTEINDRDQLKTWGWSIGIVGSLFMLVLIVYSWRQWREWRVLKAQLRAAAEERRKLAATRPGA
ncbi:MAG TPA: hypothetical protein VEL07_08730 [Planctomycetota bacterium]|nr:hypothetical protein [Planctomycetota bacterium]